MVLRQSPTWVRTRCKAVYRYVFGANTELVGRTPANESRKAMQLSSVHGTMYDTRAISYAGQSLAPEAITYLWYTLKLECTCTYVRATN